MDAGGIRINKFLSELGICSRREADKWIEQGRVQVNRKTPLPGTRIFKRDEVRVDGRVVSKIGEPEIYLALNKPPGIVCTTDPAEPDNIVQYVNFPKRIFPIGRLDKPSEGLIFLTSDGDIVNKILRAGNNHEKEYEVTVNKIITPEFISKMTQGVPIMGTKTKKCRVEALSSNTFRIVLVQGMNRQIRRMCEFFEYEVVKLKRVRIMNISLDLTQGEWRELTVTELSEIERLTANSTKHKKTASRSGSPIKHKKASRHAVSAGSKKRLNGRGKNLKSKPSKRKNRK